MTVEGATDGAGGPDGRVGAITVLAAVLLLAVSARFSVPIPGSPVPQSAQTLAVVVVGAVLGARMGFAALAAYLLAGAVGAPVFADGAAGAAHLVGPTSGYLLGFLVAAGVLGQLTDRGHLNSIPRAAAWMAAAHGLILLLGGARLSTTLGLSGALEAGVTPFLWGGVVKSLAGAAIALPLRRRVGSVLSTSSGSES